MTQAEVIWVARLRIFLSKNSLIWWVALTYLALITLAEVLTTLIDPVVGLSLHGLVLLLLLLQAVLSDHIQSRRFLLALTLAPLTRLLSLVLPLQHFPLVYWYALVGAPLAIAAIFAARAGRLRRVELGLRLGKLPLQALIGLTGIGLGYLEYRILRPKPLVAELRWELIWLPALILLVFTGFLEELIYRGLIQRSATQRLGRAGLVYTSAVFTVLHLGYHSWLDLVFVFGVAMFFSWLVQRSGSILGVSLAHGLTNITLFLVFPFLLSVPSLPTIGSPIIEPIAPVVLERAPVISTTLTDLSRATSLQPLIILTVPILDSPVDLAPVTEMPTFAQISLPYPYRCQLSGFLILVKES